MKSMVLPTSIQLYFATLRQRLGSSIFAFDFSQNSSVRNSFSSSFNARKLKQFFKNSPYLPFILVLIVVVVIAIIAIRNFAGRQTVSAPQASSDPRVTIEKPIATQTINKTFTFPLKDQSQKVISQITYEVQSVELRDQILVKGQLATAIKGREFLIVNLKITNNFDKDININARDYIRLVVNNSSDKLAPDIHNDPVEVQAISTKYTRVGFPINDTDKNLTLQVGEISGNKQLIKLTLK